MLAFGFQSFSAEGRSSQQLLAVEYSWRYPCLNGDGRDGFVFSRFCRFSPTFVSAFSQSDDMTLEALCYLMPNWFLSKGAIVLHSLHFLEGVYPFCTGQ